MKIHNKIYLYHIDDRNRIDWTHVVSEYNPYKNAVPLDNSSPKPRKLVALPDSDTSNVKNSIEVYLLAL